MALPLSIPTCKELTVPVWVTSKGYHWKTENLEGNGDYYNTHNEQRSQHTDCLTTVVLTSVFIHPQGSRVPGKQLPFYVKQPPVPLSSLTFWHFYGGQAHYNTQTFSRKPQCIYCASAQSCRWQNRGTQQCRDLLRITWQTRGKESKSQDSCVHSLSTTQHYLPSPLITYVAPPKKPRHQLDWNYYLHYCSISHLINQANLLLKYF